MNHTESSVAQASLRFTLPLTSGQSIVVLGNAPALVEALSNSGLLALMICPGACQDLHREEFELLRCTAGKRHSLPLRTSSVDHIIIPELTQDINGWIPGEILRILKRQGTLGMGFANRTSLGRWRSRSQHRGTGLKSLSGSSIEHWLADRGLRLTSRYGVWATLQKPKYLVPLHHKDAAKFFFAHLFIPYTEQGAVARPFVSLAARLGWRQALFPYLYIVASLS